MPEIQNIVRRMTQGIAWMVAARLLDRMFGVVSTLVLARLLVPADFGLVAMATAVASLLELLGAFSFDLALIQKTDTRREHYDTVWTFGVLFGLTFAALLLLLAAPAAAFYHEPRLVSVMYVMALSYVVGAFNNVGVVAFRKELEFHKEFQFILIRRLVTFGVTLGTAWYLQSYWALLIGTLAGRIVNCITSYTMHSYRPRLSLAAAGELFHFSKWLLINNFLFYLLNNGSSFVIGRLLGARALGLFTVSNEIASLPSTELVAPINRATFPALSKLQSGSEATAVYLKLFAMITLLILPVGFGIAAVAPQLVTVMLGAQWLAAIPLLQCLAIYGALAATQGNNSTMWLAAGHPRMTTLIGAIFVAVLFPALYIALPYGGLEAVGYAYLATCAVYLPTGMVLTQRLLRFRWGAIGALLYRPLLGVLVMWLAVRGALALLPAAPAALQLAALCLAGALAYPATVLLLWRLAGRPDGAEAFLLKKIGWLRD
ncbi:lipopolysaccharide biosynthesis protein [Massilia sp. SR12]